MCSHKIDYDDWHASVHGSLDYEKFLQVGSAGEQPGRRRGCCV